MSRSFLQRLIVPIQAALILATAIGCASQYSLTSPDGTFGVRFPNTIHPIPMDSVLFRQSDLLGAWGTEANGASYGVCYYRYPDLQPGSAVDHEPIRKMLESVAQERGALIVEGTPLSSKFYAGYRGKTTKDKDGLYWYMCLFVSGHSRYLLFVRQTSPIIDEQQALQFFWSFAVLDWRAA